MADLARLTRELAEARETNRRLHRRTQEAESLAAKAWRQNDTERLWRTVAHLREWNLCDHRKAERWRNVYRDAMAQIRKAGVIDVASYRKWARPGDLEVGLDVLIDRLIAAAGAPWWRRVLRSTHARNTKGDTEK